MGFPRPSFSCLTFTHFLGQNRKQGLLSDLGDILGLQVRSGTWGSSLNRANRKSNQGQREEQAGGPRLCQRTFPPPVGSERAWRGGGDRGARWGRSLETEAGHLCESIWVSRAAHLSSVTLAASGSQAELWLLRQPPPVRTCDSSLTCAAIIGHVELGFLGLVASQAQAPPRGVEPYLSRLQVDGRLSVPRTGGVLFGPVRFI